MTVEAALSPCLVAVQPEDRHRDDIQGLRAVAVVMVVGFHAGLPMPGGFTGVDVFFVISGFVITSMLQREWRSTGRIAFGQFYLRRFKRLTPALALMVTITLVGSLFLVSPLGGPQGQTFVTGGAAMLLMANFALAAITGGYFGSGADTNALLHTWSLSVEEQFYLAFPLLLAAAWRLAERNRGFRPAFIVVGAAAASFTVCLSRGGDVIAFYSALTRAWEFAAGATLALLGPAIYRMSRTVMTAVALTGAALLVVSTFAINATTAFPGCWTLVPVAGTLGLILGGSGSNVMSRALSSRWACFLGDRSYSLYLWHWPFIVWAANLWPQAPAATTAAAVVSLAPAFASYRFVETRFRRWSPAGRVRVACGARSIVAVPLVVALCLTVAFTNYYGYPQIAVRRVAMGLHVGASHGCLIDDPDFAWRERECTWNAGAGGAPIYLVGDSNADHFSEAVVAAGEKLGRPVVISTYGSCPALDARLWNTLRNSALDRGCHAFVDDTITRLTGGASGLVIVAGSDKYLSEDGYGFGPSRDQLATDQQARLTEWAQGTTRLVTTLERAGQKVMLVQTVPRWEGTDSWDPRRCTFAGFLTQGQSWCSYRMALEDANARQAIPRQAIAQIALTTHAALLDFGPTICPSGTCVSATGEHVTYRDSEHLTPAENDVLIPELVSAIRGG